MSTRNTTHRAVQTPIGVIHLEATDAALVAVRLPGESPITSAESDPDPSHPILDLAARELTELLDGRRRDFATPLAPHGTDFQRDVWAALSAIPYGETRSYADIARAIGRPTAVRAVGAANGRNPLPIFVPCHRVIGADGSLTGYGGGLDTKRWLLALERRACATPFDS